MFSINSGYTEPPQNETVLDGKLLLVKVPIKTKLHCGGYSHQLESLVMIRVSLGQI